MSTVGTFGENKARNKDIAIHRAASVDELLHNMEPMFQTGVTLEASGVTHLQEQSHHVSHVWDMDRAHLDTGIFSHAVI